MKMGSSRVKPPGKRWGKRKKDGGFRKKHWRLLYSEKKDVLGPQTPNPPFHSARRRGSKRYGGRVNPLPGFIYNSRRCTKKREKVGLGETDISN